jgi:hypothetical protein
MVRAQQGTSAVAWSANDIFANYLTAGDMAAMVQTAVVGAPRIRLLSTANYYVSASGNDSNPGTLSQPWLTLQHAWNYVLSALDLNNQSVIINVADGTYTMGALCLGQPVGFGPGSAVTFLGDAGTPDNCIVNASSGSCFAAEAGAAIVVNGFRMTASAGSALLVEVNGQITYLNSDFGTCSAGQINCSGGLVQWGGTGSYTISGGSTAHFFTGAGGQIGAGFGTVTVTGTPTFSTAFALASGPSVIQSSSLSFVGSVTGQRYLAQDGAFINTSGGGANYFPGTIAGTSATGYYA